MSQRGEIYYIFLAAFAQRAPRWVHALENNIVKVCLIIETYDTRYQCQNLLGDCTYIRAVPRDCARIIFKHLRGSRWNKGALLRKFVGGRPREYPSEGSGIAGRPDSSEYSVVNNGVCYNIFYDLEMVFTCKPGRYFAFFLGGYRHNNNMVLSGRSAELLDELWAGAVTMAGSMIVPQRLRYNGHQYTLDYYCWGYLIASTYISPGQVHTFYAGLTRLYTGIYSLDIATPAYKQRIFSLPWSQ